MLRGPRDDQQLAKWPDRSRAPEEWAPRQLEPVATGQGLNIQPRKWLLGTGNSFGGFSGMGPAPTNALYAYRKEESRIRIPVVPLLRTPLQYDGIYQKTTYYGRIGVVENVYPELTALRTGIN